MKRLSILQAFPVFIITAALLFSPVSPAYAKSKKRGLDKLKFPPLNEIKLPEIQKAETGNGIKLRLIKDDKLPLVTVRAILKGGDAYDPASKVGLIDITAQLLRIGGTKEHKPEELDKILDANGISISFSSDNDSFSISLSCLEENFDQALALLAKMVREPAFDEEKLDEIKTKMGTSISRRNDEPSSINRREFRKLIYGAASPFAAQLEYEHLDNISRKDILTVHRTFFTSGNLLVGVVGPLEIGRVKELFEKHLGTWKTQTRIPPYPKVKAPAHDFKVAIAEKSSLNQSYLSIGHLGIRENLEEKAKIKVFNSIFSQGFASRLMNKIRARMGLTYGVGGGINTQELYPGTTSFSTFTKCESTIEAIKAIQAEIDLIRKEKVTEKELQNAKNYFLNSFVFEYRSPSRILMNSLRKEFYGIPANADEKLQEDIKKVSADDVLEIAKKYLHPEKMIILVVSNEKKIKGKLSDLGKVKKVDISIKPPAMKEKIPPATPESLAKGQKLIDALAAGKYKGYKSLKSLESTVNAKMTMQGRTFEMALKTSIIHPDKFHTEVSVMGMKMYRIINGKKGVMNQMGQKRPIPEKDIEKGVFGDFYDVFNAKDKYKFQYLKEEQIDGKTFDIIYIFDADKNWVKFFVNRETGLIEMQEKIEEVPGQTGVGRRVSSDFKTIRGIPFAFKSVTTIKDKPVREIMVKEIKVNPGIDPSLFKIEEEKK
jgi:zinc protease